MRLKVNKVFEWKRGVGLFMLIGCAHEEGCLIGGGIGDGELIGGGEG